MSKDEVVGKLVEIIYQLQELSGEEEIKITDGTRPFNDLPGFDSLRLAEAAAEVGGEFGFDVADLLVKYICKLGAKIYNLTISQIGNKLVKLFNLKKKGNK